MYVTFNLSFAEYVKIHMAMNVLINNTDHR